MIVPRPVTVEAPGSVDLIPSADLVDGGWLVEFLDSGVTRRLRVPAAGGNMTDLLS